MIGYGYERRLHILRRKSIIFRIIDLPLKFSIREYIQLIGVLGFWGFGVLGFWGFGVLGFWGFGVKEALELGIGSKLKVNRGMIFRV